MQGTIHSRHPQHRRDAAAHGLAEAEKALADWAAATDHDADYLRERRQGAKAEVQNWRRYIRGGCPWVRGSA